MKSHLAHVLPNTSTALHETVAKKDRCLSLKEKSHCIGQLVNGQFAATCPCSWQRKHLLFLQLGLLGGTSLPSLGCQALDYTTEFLPHLFAMLTTCFPRNSLAGCWGRLWLSVKSQWGTYQRAPQEYQLTRVPLAHPFLQGDR